MKGYKGFEHGLKCLGKQYAENTVFEEEKANVCECGMHFCARPLDVLKYYDPCDGSGTLNDFCEVEALDEALTNDNEKYCTRKLKVGAKIGIVGLIKAEVEYIKAEIDKIPKWRKAVNSGYSSVAVNSGYRSAAVNSGYSSAAVNSGYRSAAVNSGDSSAAVNSGYSSVAVNSGYRSAAVNSGYSSAAVNSGDSSAAVNSGAEGVAIALGIGSKAKAALGGWIVISEWAYNRGWHRIALRSAQVDGEKIKADTWYTLKNGEFEEVPE